MPFSAILLLFKFLMFSFLQVCKFTDLQVHNSIDCPYFYGLSVKISDLLHLPMVPKCIPFDGLLERCVRFTTDRYFLNRAGRLKGYYP